MGSKYLNSLARPDYDLLIKKLASIQNNICYICCKKIDLSLHEVNVDHIIPLANRGKDSEDNFALTHEGCNKSKQDANLKIARILYKMKSIQDEAHSKEGKTASLKHVLLDLGGSKHDFKFTIDNQLIRYSFSGINDNNIYTGLIFTDKLSGEKTFFIEAPIEYVFHDEVINPRGINSSISLLVKEFEKGNPQLHLTLARIHEGKLRVFDGQHKAVAQLLLGGKKLVLRVFIDPDIDRLIETNTNAGSTLRQIVFDKSIMRQLNNTLYIERIKKYQEDHSLSPDDLSFSEQQLVDHFKGENANIKKYIIDSIKHSITFSKDNKLKDFIDFEGKAKELPISHSAFDKTFLKHFLDNKLILQTAINFRSDEGKNPRELEITQIVNLLNIIAEEVYIRKFIPEIGVYRIENRIIDKNDIGITDDHLAAYRISKEEVLFNWILYLRNVIVNYFNNTGKIYDNKKLFQNEFDNQLWKNIRNFIKNIIELPLWKDRSMASTIFSGKNTYDYWEQIFRTGKSPDGVQVLAKPLNFVEMINRTENDL